MSDRETPLEAIRSAAAAIHCESCEWDLDDCIAEGVHDRAGRAAIEAAAPYIQAAERERVRRLALEYRATYYKPEVINGVQTGGLYRFADLIGDES